MLDLVEGTKIVSGIAPTTQGSATVKMDYVSMKDAHTVWAVINIKDHTSGPTVTPYVASAYAGTGSSAITGGAQFWINNNTTNLDRMTVSTATTALAFSDAATDGLMVVRYDPSASASSNSYFCIGLSTAGAAKAGTVSAEYYLETRYGGYQQVIATTSST
jgi:hypothetical protein